MISALRSLVLLAGVASAAPAFSQPAVNAENVYKDSCATCHDNPQGRTPSRAALKDRSAEAILLAMTTGSMTIQAGTLTIAEKRALAELLSGKTLPSAGAGSASNDASLCQTQETRLAAFSSKPQWNGFGVDPANSRFQKTPGLTAADVPNLKLKWAFGFPGGSQAYGNPAIVGGRIFVGSDTGKMYSLDAQTGCTYWSFQADAGIRSAPSVEARPSAGSGQRPSAGSGQRPSAGSGQRPARGSGQAAADAQRHVVYFGDLKANVYALDAATGAQLWKKQTDAHRSARVTGSIKLHDGKLYVPMSSIEEGPAAQPTYECCTFRGSVVALDAATGEQVWKTFTISETPQPVGKNSKGTTLYGPAGVAVWNTPTIDTQKGVLYVGTGNSYTEPAVKTSDSVMAMDLKTGKMLWFSQLTPSDAFVVGCRPGVENCPKEVGPDFDIGTSPILRTLPGGKRVLVVGQKSGLMWGIDPDNEGKVLWQYRAGKGSALGGIEWGTAADDENVYVPVSDVLAPPNEAGGIHAVSLATGQKVWSTPAPKLECNTGRGCTGAQSAPASVIPGVVFSGSVDGHIRAYSTADGSILWDFNTAKEFTTVNGVAAKGGSIDAAGPAIADGLVVTNSGYSLWRGLPGNVLLVFSK